MLFVIFDRVWLLVDLTTMCPLPRAVFPFPTFFFPSQIGNVRPLDLDSVGYAVSTPLLGFSSGYLRWELQGALFGWVSPSDVI